MTGWKIGEMTMAADPTIIVDARGHRCPTPTLRLRRALEAAGPGALGKLLADDPMARIDVPHFVQSKGYVLLETDENADGLCFIVRKST
jgi:tRNA 2-thiouridine synthesizing protein A